MTSHDLAALLAAAASPADAPMALCTLVGLDGSFSRRLGAQIAVAGDGSTIGSLSDGCLERQLAAEAAAAREAGERRLFRFGAGSPFIDFRLPCGSGVDVLVDPAPDRDALRAAAARLGGRMESALDLPLPDGASADLLARRRYIPNLRILLFGEGPELEAAATLAEASGALVEAYRREDADTAGLALGRLPDGLTADRWTAVLLLFHDHEWERAILRWALATPAFYIGAQGGAAARDARRSDLVADGFGDEALVRVRSPIGVIPHARDPGVLALSVLAEIVAGHEALHPHR